MYSIINIIYYLKLYNKYNIIIVQGHNYIYALLYTYYYRYLRTFRRVKMCFK